MIEHPEYYKNVYAIAEKAEAKNGLEIGLMWGESAHAFLSANPEATLISVDLKDDAVRAGWLGTEFPGRFTYRQGRSPETVEAIEGKFDWIYIDGDHEYGSVKADIAACLPKLKRRGLLVFDDYGVFEGVTNAVDELLAANKHLKPFLQHGPVKAVRLA